MPLPPEVVRLHVSYFFPLENMGAFYFLETFFFIVFLFYFPVQRLAWVFVTLRNKC